VISMKSLIPLKRGRQRHTELLEEISVAAGIRRVCQQEQVL
jgi:hypothetical protein